MRLNLCKPILIWQTDLETWTGHLSVCTIRKWHITMRWDLLGCQPPNFGLGPPNFDPQISPKWHNSVKKCLEMRLKLCKPYINGFRNVDWTS